MSTAVNMLNKKLAIGAILAPTIIIGLFLLVFLPGARHVSSHLGNFKIAVVNQAGDIGTTIESKVRKNIPFTVETNLHESAAQSALNRGDIQMVMVIPDDFAASLGRGQGKLNFIMNAAVPTDTESAMQSAEEKITDAVNQAAIEMEKQGIVKGISKNLQQSSLPAPIQTQITKLVTPAVAKLQTQPVQNIERVVNSSTNSVSALLPFLTIITFFIGSMMTTALSWMAVQAIRTSNRNRYTTGLAQLALNILAAVVVAALDLLLFHTFGADPVSSGWTAWWSLSLGYFAMCVLIQMFVYLVGLPGMIVGLLLFPLQLISAGALLPTQLLPSAYTALASWLPTPYLTGVVFSMFMGGGVFSKDTSSLMIISIVCLAVMFLRLSFPTRTASRFAGE